MVINNPIIIGGSGSESNEKLKSIVQKTITAGDINDVSENANIITKYCYSFCENMTTMNFRNRTVHIEKGAFLNSGLEGELQIPSSVTRIEAEGFKGTKITSLTFQNRSSSISLGSECFAEIPTLISAELPGTATSDFSDGRLFKTFIDDYGLESVVLSDGITSLENTFENCYALKSVQLPETLTTIGINTFKSTALSAISIPDSVSTIGTDAFRSTEFTGKLVLPSGLTALNDIIRDVDSGLKKVVIPSLNLTKINYFSDRSRDCYLIISEPPTLQSRIKDPNGVGYFECFVFVPEGSVSDYKTAGYIDEYNKFNDIYPLQTIGFYTKNSTKQYYSKTNAITVAGSTSYFLNLDLTIGLPQGVSTTDINSKYVYTFNVIFNGKRYTVEMIPLIDSISGITTYTGSLILDISETGKLTTLPISFTPGYSYNSSGALQQNSSKSAFLITADSDISSFIIYEVLDKNGENLLEIKSSESEVAPSKLFYNGTKEYTKEIEKDSVVYYEKVINCDRLPTYSESVAAGSPFWRISFLYNGTSYTGIFNYDSSKHSSVMEAIDGLDLSMEFAYNVIGNFYSGDTEETTFSIREGKCSFKLISSSSIKDLTISSVESVLSGI